MERGRNQPWLPSESRSSPRLAGGSASKSAKRKASSVAFLVKQAEPQDWERSDSLLVGWAEPQSEAHIEYLSDL